VSAVRHLLPLTEIRRLIHGGPHSAGRAAFLPFSRGETNGGTRRTCFSLAGSRCAYLRRLALLRAGAAPLAMSFENGEAALENGKAINSAKPSSARRVFPKRAERIRSARLRCPRAR